MIELNENSKLSISNNSLVCNASAASLLVVLGSVTFKANSAVSVTQNRFAQVSNVPIRAISISKVGLSLSSGVDPTFNFTGDYSSFSIDDNTFTFPVATSCYAIQMNLRELMASTNSFVSISGNNAEVKSSQILFTLTGPYKFHKFYFANNTISTTGTGQNSGGILQLSEGEAFPNASFVLSNNTFYKPTAFPIDLFRLPFLESHAPFISPATQ